MKIKKSKKREWVSFLARVVLVACLIAVMSLLTSVERVVGNGYMPNYKDGDLVFKNKMDGNNPFLLVRVRGFDD